MDLEYKIKDASGNPQVVRDYEEVYPRVSSS